MGRFRWVAPVAVVAATTAAFAAEPAVAAPARGVVAASSPTVLAVWALSDGDTPVVDGRVRVYPAARGGRATSGEPLRLVGGASAARTTASGTALVAVRRAPAQVVVEVTGGTRRSRLPGPMRAVVGRDVAGGIVHVTPITTLTVNLRDEHRRRGRSVSPAAARRGVNRLLGIPQWVDDHDLRRTDAFFDGDAHRRAAHRVGSVEALHRRLIRRALRGGHTSAFRGRSQATATADLGPLAKKVFAALEESAINSLPEALGRKAGETILGWVLAGFGLQGGDDDQLTKEDLDAIKQTLDQLEEHLTQTQTAVQLAGFSTLVGQTETVLGQIDTAASQLALLAATPADDPTKRRFAQSVDDYIAARLVDAPATINRALAANVPLSDNILKSASRLVGGSERFLDSESSAKVASVFDYYAGYQAQLAMLLEEHFHANPGTYSPANAGAQLTALQASVTAQGAAVKPSIPEGTVLDTKTGQMWTKKADPVGLGGFMTITGVLDRNNVTRFRRTYTRLAGPTGLGASRNSSGVPFTDWRMPTTDDLAGLVAGWSGDSPLAWLVAQGRFDQRGIGAQGFGGRLWTIDGPATCSAFLGDLVPVCTDTRGARIEAYFIVAGRFALQGPGQGSYVDDEYRFRPNNLPPKVSDWPAAYDAALNTTSGGSPVPAGGALWHRPQDLSTYFWTTG